MKITHEIEQQAAEHVRIYLSSKLSQSYCYHNLLHTENVVSAIEEISDGMGLSEQDQLIVLVAGWFHDIGYIFKIEGHEQVGARLAEQFLLDRKVDAEEISKVQSCILA